MIKRHHVVSEFFPEAEAMRTAYDNKVKDAYKQAVPWQYFCVPQMYTYLRTAPQQLFPEPLFAKFWQHMKQWCIEHTGLMPAGMPHFHMMVDGCTLGLHSDFHNGTLGFVYSLTRWQKRTFLGGETLLMRDGVPSYKKHHVQGEVLYELVPAQFNQLLVFDDRLVHGTQTIEGNMDPREARIAMVGHLRPTSPVVRGPLDAAAAWRTLAEMYGKLGERLREHKDVQGTVTVKLAVSASGAVDDLTVLVGNLVVPATGYEPSPQVDAVMAVLREALTALRFPSAREASTVIAAVLVPLPDLRPIEIAVPHASRPARLQELLKAALKSGEELGFQVELQGDTFVVREPLAGTIRIEPARIVAAFDAPMWVPSQRDRFQSLLTEQFGQLARA